jgi:hypothetical protein
MSGTRAPETALLSPLDAWRLREEAAACSKRVSERDGERFWGSLRRGEALEDLDLPGYRLHLLKGVDKGRWSIWVNGNWRLTFVFRDGHVFDLDFEDYH